MQDIEILRCPNSHHALKIEQHAGQTFLVSTIKRYPVLDQIPVFRETSNEEARLWQANSCDVSIMIMTLNEAENIEAVISSCVEELKKTGLSFEIVVVDGGSKDNTTDLAAKLGARVLKQTPKGYAEDLKQGFAALKGEFVITLDGDCSHPAALIPVLLSKRSEADIIVASRWIKGGKFEGPLLRLFLSKFLNLVFKKVLAIPVNDLSSGYRLYRRNVLCPEGYQAKDFSILEEILIRAFTDGFTIMEIPLHYFPRKSGSSKARLAEFALSYLRTLGGMWMLRNDSGSADYDNRAYDSKNLVQRWWQRSRYKNIMSLLGEFKGKGAVLDIGCGCSRIIQNLPHAVAFDYSLKKLRFLKKTNPLRVCGSALELPFKDQSFDCIIHSQLIEHLPRDDKIFTELRRVLKPKGTLIMGTVDYGTFIWPLIEKIYGILMPHAYADEHITHYTLDSLQATLLDFGFKTTQVKTIVRGEITLKAQLQ